MRILEQIWYWIKGIFTRVKTIRKVFTPTYIEYNWHPIAVEIADEVNLFRATNMRDILVRSNELATFAVERCVHNIERYKFNPKQEPILHDGLSIVRIKAYALGINALSENLAYGYTNASSVVRSWRRSDGHRKLMLNNHKHMGIGIMEDTNNRLTFCLLTSR